jgi:hypothetical protein
VVQKPGGRSLVTRALRFACTRRAARAACEISNSKSFFAQFPEQFEEPTRGVARRVHAPRTALVRVEARQVRAPAENGDASMGRPVVGRATGEKRTAPPWGWRRARMGSCRVDPGSWRGRIGVDFRRTNPMRASETKPIKATGSGAKNALAERGGGLTVRRRGRPGRNEANPARPAQVPTKNPTGSDPGRRSRTGSARA